MADTPGSEELNARLDALRSSGANERDPVRFAHLEALSRRVAAQPPAIRRPLLARLDALASELAIATAPLETDNPAAAASPLADLLAYISQQAHAPHGGLQPRAVAPATDGKAPPQSRKAPPGPELKAVAIFRDAWSRLSTEQQLTQTLAQAPENAGPMNSQHLVLRSLQVMRDIAPDYLQGFMSYVDTLIWLEQADPTRQVSSKSQAGEGEKKAKSPRRSTAKKQAADK